MECAFVLFCVKRASIYLAMQTIFSLNCSIFTQTRIIRQSCLCHGVELQINCWQSSHKSPAQLQVPERRNPANQIQTQDNLFMRLQRTFDLVLVSVLRN